LINTVAAWAIDHPGEPIDNTKVFAAHLKRLRDAVFAERRVAIGRLCRDVVHLLREEGAGLDEPRRKAAENVVIELERRFGYEPTSTADAALALVRLRFADVLR
jgi:hypothetical protein